MLTHVNLMSHKRTMQNNGTELFNYSMNNKRVVLHFNFVHNWQKMRVIKRQLLDICNLTRPSMSQTDSLNGPTSRLKEIEL